MIGMGTMQLVDYETRENWLAARREGVGASEVSILFGLAPSSWGSPYTLWLEKTGRAEKEINQGDEPEWLEMGREMEPVVARVYERRTNRKLWQGGSPYTVAIDPQQPLVRATPDRHILDPQDVIHTGLTGTGVLEAKNVGFYRAHDWDEETPPHVQCQVQTQIGCADVLWGSAAGILGGNHFVYRDLLRNEAFIDEVRATVEDFWKYVTRDVPPPIDGSEATERALKRLHPRDSGDAVELPAEADFWWQTIVESKAAIKAATEQLEAELKAAENNLRAAIGSATYGVLPDGRRLTLFTTDRGGYIANPTSYRTLKLESLKKPKKGKK